MLLLAIESSCDETAACVMDGDGRVLSDIIFTQMDTHKEYGGVVPEIASRMHLEALPFVVHEALDKAGAILSDIDKFAVTFGPGLAGALLCGVNYAKGLAYALGRPLLGIHHMEGHIMANHVTHRELKPPYLCLICSGGHTQLVHVKAPFDYRLVGQTRDDAAGEAFDKTARALGLPYPGGINLEELAKTGNPKAFSFTKPRCENPYDYSFSGLKTAVITLLRNRRQQGETVNLADVAASFQAHAIDFLLLPAFAALHELGMNVLSVVGGVCANQALRARAYELAGLSGNTVLMPEKGLCTDNAVMIAEAARRRFALGQHSDFALNAVPNVPFYGLEMSHLL
jgi:N6-L-threonylcarbamoyladenine synthase